MKKSGNLVLRHSLMNILPFHTFCRILEVLLVEWRNSTPYFASLPERGNLNIKYINILALVAPVDWDFNPQPVAFTVARLCPCAMTDLFLPYVNLLCPFIKKSHNFVNDRNHSWYRNNIKKTTNIPIEKNTENSLY